MGSPALQKAVARALAAARARRPALKWDPAPLEAWLGEQLREPAQLESVELDDLLLARAAAAHDPVAIAELERQVLPTVRGALLRVNASDAFVQDALQELRRKLLVGPPPRIQAYSGRGPLKAWLRAAATGTALNLLRTQSPKHTEEVDEDTAAIEANAAVGADIALVKARHAPQFSKALREAMATLSPQERLVLRMRFIDGLSREEIGAFFKVHRTTALRWLEKAQGTLLTRTREALARELTLSVDELDSLIRYLHSGVGASLVNALKQE